MIGVLALWLVGAAAPNPSEPAVLRRVGWSLSADTLHLDLEFEGARPTRQRIGPPEGAASARELRIDLQGARMGDSAGMGWPRWLRGDEDRDAGTVSLRIDLAEPAPWKASWRQDDLRIDLIGRGRPTPFWRSPWILGVAGTAAVAGGVAIWMGSGDGSVAASAPGPAGDDVIPPPDVAFPR